MGVLVYYSFTFLLAMFLATVELMARGLYFC